MKRLDSLEASYRCCWWGFWLFIILLAVGWLTSCTTTRYVPVEHHTTDTVYQSKLQRDSVWLHDSIRVSEKGDTIRIERWRTKYISKEVHDTLYQATHDSIPVPYPVEKLVPRERGKMEWVLILAGCIAIVVMFLWIVNKLKRYLPFMRY